MKIEELAMKTDYGMLREQKAELVSLASKLYDEGGNGSYVEALDGIINLLDAFQDAVVAEGFKTEAEVFGDA